MEFLQGLHEKYFAVRNQILLLEPFRSTKKSTPWSAKKRCHKNLTSVLFWPERLLSLSLQTTIPTTLPIQKAISPLLRPFVLPWSYLSNMYLFYDFPDKHHKKIESSYKQTSAFTLINQLTPGQYNKLLALLSKDGSANNSVNLAGPVLSCTI